MHIVIACGRHFPMSCTWPNTHGKANPLKVDSAMLLASHLGHLCLLSLSLLGLALIYINMLVWIAFLWLQTKLLLAMAFTLRVAYEDPKCNSTEFVDQTPISPLPKQQPQDRKDPYVSITVCTRVDTNKR